MEELLSGRAARLWGPQILASLQTTSGCVILDKLVSPHFDFGVIQNSEVLLNRLDFLAIFDFMACGLGRFLTMEELSWTH